MSLIPIGHIPSHVPPAASATVLAICVVVAAAAADVCTPSLYCFMAYSYSFRLPNPLSPSLPPLCTVLIKCLAYFLGPTAALAGKTSLQLAMSTLPGCPISISLFLYVCCLSVCRV